eukprot:scaffold26.g3315.t1
MANLFSVPALLIMLREALEAAVIIAVLLQIMNKLRMPQLKKWVWIGALGGVGIALLLGVVFVVLFYILGNKVFSGSAELIFKGCVCWLATLLITMVAFHMLKFYNMERKWRRKLEAATATQVGAAPTAAPGPEEEGPTGDASASRRASLDKAGSASASADAAEAAEAGALDLAASSSKPLPSSSSASSDESAKLSAAEAAAEAAREETARKQRWPLVLLAGTATLREGVESVLFLAGVSAGTGVTSIIIPGILGIVLGFICGVILFYTGKTIRSLKWFFIFSCVLLLLIAAGLVVTGTGFFASAYLFGNLYPNEMRPWYLKVVWDTSACCDDTKNQGWAILKALFGYTSQPTALQLMYYCLYWGVVAAVMIYRAWRGTLTDRHKAAIDDFESFVHHQRGAGTLPAPVQALATKALWAKLVGRKGTTSHQESKDSVREEAGATHVADLVAAEAGGAGALHDLDPDEFEFGEEDPDEYEDGGIAQYSVSVSSSGSERRRSDMSNGLPGPEPRWLAPGATTAETVSGDTSSSIGSGSVGPSASSRSLRARRRLALRRVLGMLLLLRSAAVQFGGSSITAVAATSSALLQLCAEGGRAVDTRLVRLRHLSAAAFKRSPAGHKVQQLVQSVDNATVDLPEDAWARLLWLWERPSVQKFRLAFSMANISIRLPAIMALVATQVGLLASQVSLPMLAPLLLGGGMLLRSIKANASFLFPRLGLLVVLLWLLWFANSVVQSTTAYLRKQASYCHILVGMLNGAFCHRPHAFRCVLAVRRMQGALDQRLAGAVVTGSEIFSLLTAGIVLLSTLGVNVSALLLPAGVAVAIAAKDLSHNFLAGFFLFVVQPFKLGDRVAVSFSQPQGPGLYGAGSSAWFEGVCEKVDLRYTSIRQGRRRLMVPNSAFLTREFMVLEDSTAPEPSPPPRSRAHAPPAAAGEGEPELFWQPFLTADNRHVWQLVAGPPVHAEAGEPMRMGQQQQQQPLGGAPEALPRVAAPDQPRSQQAQQQAISPIPGAGPRVNGSAHLSAGGSGNYPYEYVHGGPTQHAGPVYVDSSTSRGGQPPGQHYHLAGDSSSVEPGACWQQQPGRHANGLSSHPLTDAGDS